MTGIQNFSLLSDINWGNTEAKNAYICSTIPTHGSATSTSQMHDGRPRQLYLKALNPQFIRLNFSFQFLS